MFLKKLAIHNYKSLRNVCFTPEPFAALIGPNASGKSNFADAVHFLSEVYEHGLETAIARKGGYENIAFRKQRRTTAPIEFDIEGVQVLYPAYADMQPKSTPAQIARYATSRIDLLLARNVDSVLVLIDREDRLQCPPTFARKIERAIKNLDYENVRVVVKKRTFENWLIADVEALKGMGDRFKVSKASERKIAPNKADHVANAKALLDRMSVKHEFHKRRDATAITAVQDPLRIAANSRSFRRFLRLIGHPEYRDQSKRPFLQP